MIGWITSLIPMEWLVAAVGALVAVITAWVGGSRSAKAKAENKALKEDVKAHDRITKADTGAGLSDDDRVARLSAFAAKHRAGSAKKPRR